MIVSKLPSNRLKAYFSIIQQSLNGKTQEYTSGSIRRAVILLAIPMMLEMCMESVFAVVDIFFVSHLGRHATSTVGLTESVVTIIYAIAVGISMAATAMVARRIGEKDPQAAAVAGMQSIFISLLITIVLSIPGMIFARDILRLMGAEPATVQHGAIYTRIVMGSSIVIMLLFLINGIFRGAGDAMMAMKSLWLANICNIILCPVLIRGLGPIPAFGLAGAAMATMFGRSVGVLYQLYHLFNGKSKIRFSLSQIMPDFTIIKNVISIAWPATLQFLIGSGSWILMARLVAQTGGSEASAGYQIAIRIVMFFILPAWGMSNAAATLVGQNLGAGNPERAEQSVMQAVKFNLVFMALMTCFFLFFTPWIIHFFSMEEKVAMYAIEAVRIISAGYIFYGVAMVLSNAFNGAGDTRTPTILNLFVFWFLQVPVAYIFSKYLGFGPPAVFAAIPVAETVLAISAYFLFKKGRWKLKKI